MCWTICIHSPGAASWRSCKQTGRYHQLHNMLTVPVWVPVVMLHFASAHPAPALSPVVVLPWAIRCCNFGLLHRQLGKKQQHSNLPQRDPN